MYERNESSSSSSSTTPVNERVNFNAMPRERSKKPAWKRAACVKAMHINSHQQNTKNYFKHGLSSDDDDDRKAQNDLQEKSTHL